MPKWRQVTCKRCDKRADDGFAISKRGLCESCALAAVTEAVIAMKDKSGPLWAKHQEAADYSALGRLATTPPEGCSA